MENKHYKCVNRFFFQIFLQSYNYAMYIIGKVYYRVSAHFGYIKILGVLWRYLKFKI